MIQDEKLRLCAEALNCEIGSLEHGIYWYGTKVLNPASDDAHAFALLAWLHQQEDVFISIGGRDMDLCINGSYRINYSTDLKQFLIDSVVAVMAERRGK